MMTKKDFKFIAESLRDGRDKCNTIEESLGYDTAVKVLCSALVVINPRLNRGNFYDCYLLMED